MLTVVLFKDNLKKQVLMKRITIQDMTKMHLKPLLEILSFYHSKAIINYLFIYFELEYEKLLSCVAFITPYKVTGRYEVLNTFYRCAFASIVLSLYGHAKKIKIIVVLLLFCKRKFLPHFSCLTTGKWKLLTLYLNSP